MTRKPIDISQSTFSLGAGQMGSFRAPFTWRFEEQLTILCGPNGAGKSQLLRMTEEGLAFAPPQAGKSYKLSVENPCCAAAEVMYLPPGWELSSGGIQPLQGVYEYLLGRIQRVRDHNPSVRGAAALRRTLENRLGSKFESASQEELMHALKPHELPALDNWMQHRVPEVFSQMFVDYYLRQVDARERGESASAFEERCGPPPWMLLNDFLKECSSQFRVSSPRGIIGQFELNVLDEARGLVLRPSDMSSGEQTLFSLAIWLYGAASDGHFPRVLLLDETDAHLHTGAIPGFLRALRAVLARKYGCAIVLATHRPDTVASASEAELFVVSPGAPRLSRAASRAVAMSGITDNVVTLIPAMRIFLVEDVADRPFYESVFHTVKTACGGLPAVAAVFRPCATGAGKSRIPGGRGAVRAWVNNFRTPEFEGLVHGIVDGDDGNQAEPGIHVLPRYSFENFLVDPIVIAATLIEVEGPPPLASTRELRPGQSGQLTDLNSDELQLIADWVLERIATTQLGLGPKEIESIDYVNGRAVNVPAWLLRSKGKSLLGAAVEAFGRVFGRDDLRRGFVRLQLVPKDLRDFVKDALTAA